MERDPRHHIPRGVRQPPETAPDYIDREYSSDIHLIELVEGESPFGPPEEYDRIFSDLEKTREIAEAGKHYAEAHERNTETSKKHIEERFGLEEDESEIFFSGRGSAGILQQSLELFHPQRDSHLFVLGPSFPYIQKAALNKRDIEAKGKVIGVAPINTLIGTRLEDTIDKAMEVRKERHLRRTVMHYLCNPNTPQGDVASPEKIKEFADFCEEKGDMLLVDEAYGDWDEDENSAIPLTQDHSNMIVTRTLSKAFALGGMRIGYSVMSKEMGDIYHRTLQHDPFQTSGPQQYIAENMLRPEVVRRHLDGTPGDEENPETQGVRAKTHAIKSEFLDALDQRDVFYLPTNSRTPIFTIGGVTQNFYRNLLNEGIACAPGEGFKITHEEMDNSFVRAIIPKESSQIPEIADKIARASRMS